MITATPDEFVAARGSPSPLAGAARSRHVRRLAHAIRRCKLRPHTSQTPLIAFGSHVDVATLRAAKAAGADSARPRSKLMAELPQVVAHHLHPPVVYVEGWTAPLSAARRGVEGAQSWRRLRTARIVGASVAGGKAARCVRCIRGFYKSASPFYRFNEDRLGGRGQDVSPWAAPAAHTAPRPSARGWRSRHSAPLPSKSIGRSRCWDRNACNSSI